MTIPDYQSFMLPFLKILGDRNEHTLQEIYIKLADYFKLTESDRKEYLPSGKQLKLKLESTKIVQTPCHHCGYPG